MVKRKKKYFFGIHASRKSEEKSSGRPKHRSAPGDAPVNGANTRRPTNDGAPHYRNHSRRVAVRMRDRKRDMR